VKISITKSARPANHSEMLSFSQGANPLPRPILDSEIDRSASSLAIPIADRRPPAGSGARPSRRRSIRLLPESKAFSSSASPFQRQSLERPFLAPRERSPSDNRHFYSGGCRFHRRPPFIGAAKRVSRATRGGIGGACGRPSAESLGCAGVCSPPARPRLSRFTRPYPWPPPPTRQRNERSEVRPVFH
jgi:hypothetical protein